MENSDDWEDSEEECWEWMDNRVALERLEAGGDTEKQTMALDEEV